MYRNSNDEIESFRDGDALTVYDPANTAAWVHCENPQKAEQ